MIRLTYETFCDLCGKECDTQTFDCTSNPGLPFPRPLTPCSYRLQGSDIEMCDECAAPIVQAKHEVVEAVRRARGAKI